MLSCTCSEWDGDPGSWWYFIPNDFVQLNTKRRKRCSSCKELIDIGADCLEFERERYPYTDIEEKISGSEIDMPPLWMCEKCGEIYLNLQDIGYCLGPQDDMREALVKYHELTGFKVMEAV